ncbi:OmpA family protein [Treponema sp. OMZ 840]|uniref:OmpA family protein n=1 Tax=Treponema sp. OMZ 840 TaxID=244313 RepID=UPI003D8CB274
MSAKQKTVCVHTLASVYKRLTVYMFIACIGLAGRFYTLLSAQTVAKPSISSESFINWQTNMFLSKIKLDMNAAGFALPAGRTAGINRMHQQLPLLIKSPLLTITVDSSTLLGDVIIMNILSLEELTNIIDEGFVSAGVYGRETETLHMEHRIVLHKITEHMVLHKTPYAPKVPIEQVSSRAYTGIIIDARGSLPVHGEFINEKANPCLFPKIWDSNMELLYERNMADPAVVKTKGLVTYGAFPGLREYADRIGKDPLYIAAKEIFGIYRTDPVISRADALKILSVEENRKLLTTGKIVILLDEDVLTHAVAAPLKDKNYYFEYKQLEQFVFENKIPDVEVSNPPKGKLISIRNLRFKADSAVLLADEEKRLDLLAEALKKATIGSENTILVEGHTASVGKEQGEKILSIQRAKAIIAEMVKRGVDEKLFSHRGYGGTHPIGDNTTEEGRAQNRRVEITIIPKATYIQRIY